MGFVIGLIVAGGYGFGFWKFWSGFKRTNFERSLGNQIVLSALWPVLIVANKSYRQNFNKALKGR